MARVSPSNQRSHVWSLGTSLGPRFIFNFLENTSPQIHYSPSESQKAVKQQNVVAKVKVKTRGKDLVALTALSEAKLPPKEVKARSFEILSAIFPAANEETAKSVDWNTSVQVMGDVGFWLGMAAAQLSSLKRWTAKSAIFKLGRIQGASLKMKVEMKVGFHGKRMSKWFEWHRDLFVLETPSYSLLAGRSVSLPDSIRTRDPTVKGTFRGCNFGCNFGASCIALLSEASGVDPHLDNDNGINSILAYCKHG